MSRASTRLSPQMLELVADRFKALAEPARLQLLQLLMRGERTVGDLVDETGMGIANVSKHLQLLHAASFVTRRKHGLFVYYALADGDVVTLCNLMCGRVTRAARDELRAVARR